MKYAIGLLLVALLPACSEPDYTLLHPQTVELGTRISVTASQPFMGGSWSIDTASLPSWISVSPHQGRGPVNLIFTADRAKSTLIAADKPTLSGEVKINWGQGDELSAVTTWKVTADQFNLRGHILSGVQLEGIDIASPSSPEPTYKKSSARGVIVKYRTAAAQMVALGRSISTHNLGPQGDVRSTLLALRIAPNDIEDLGTHAVYLKVAEREIPSVRRALSYDSNVEYAVPNTILRTQELRSSASSLPMQALPVVPNAQFAPLQWALKTLGYGAVWRDMESGKYTRPVTVAVIDSEVRADHPDLEGNVYKHSEGALSILELMHPDQVGHSAHGTRVAGIIVARWGTFPAPCPGCSTSGVVGASYLAPVKVLPVEVADSMGYTETKDVVLAIQYAAGLPIRIRDVTYTNPHPAQVINLSLGELISDEEARPLCEAVQEVTNLGVLVVVAGGNEASTASSYPAACEGAVAVSSVTLSGASAPILADYSNTYSQIMLTAPGGVNLRAPTYYNGAFFNGKRFPDSIISTNWDYITNKPNYEYRSGTSYAAPQVSALAALLLSKQVTHSRDDTLALMIKTTTQLGQPGRNAMFGYGMINPAAALSAPAVSHTLGLRLQDSLGQAFQPYLDPFGRFDAYLPDGIYQVVAGFDLSANGIYGEFGEPRVVRTAELGPAQTQIDLGDLIPVP